MNLTIENTDRHSTQTLRASFSAIFLLVHRFVNSIRNTVLRCHTDQHNTVMAVKGSTLDNKQGFYFSEHGEDGEAQFSSAEALFFLG